MKKIFNKITSLLLITFMAFHMCLSCVNALEGADTSVIKIEGVENDVLVSAYRLMKVNIENGVPTEPVYDWVSGIKEWVKENFPDFEDANKFNTEKIAGDNEETNDIKTTKSSEFYDRLAAAIKDGTITLEEEPKTRNGNGQIEDLFMGNYLILIENGLKVYRPSVVNLIPEYKEDSWKITDATIVVKSSDVGITKEVDKNNVSIGDKVSYTIKIDVPNYPENAISKKFVMSDTFGSGLTMDEESIKVYGLEVKNGENKVALENDKEYTFFTNKELLTKEDVIANFGLDFDYDKIKNYEQIIVEYSMEVNESVILGVAGNNNTAYIEYSNNPYFENGYKEEHANVKIYSFGLDILKLDEEGKSLNGAHFELTNELDEVISFNEKEDGVYSLTQEETSGTTKDLVVNNEGKLLIKGLKSGTYYIKETEAPKGFIKLSQKFKIELNAEYDINNDLAIFDTEGNIINDGLISLSITNKKGFNLPITGGIGTIMFTIAGVLIIAAGLLIFIIVHKKDKEK